MEIRDIVIAGAGTMGYSMAEIFARYGYQVTIYDMSETALENAKNRIGENVQTLVQEKELTDKEAQALLKGLAYTAKKECFASCDLVVESIVENLEIKQGFYRDISRLVREDTILATNTSGLSVNTLAEST